MRAFKKAMRKMTKDSQIAYSRHHRRPRSLGGSDHEHNISLVPKHLHSAWHTLFANHTPETIAAIISERWLDPAFVMVATRKELCTSQHNATIVEIIS